MATQTEKSTDRVFNFSAGPATIPLSVLEQAQRDLLSLPGVGASILEISHRSPTFVDILASAKNNLIKLLDIPSDYEVCFVQGGSRLQFSMIPINLLRGSKTAADYIVTGAWGKKALAEAKKEGPTNVAWDGAETGYDRLPQPDEIKHTPNAAYTYITSNETIEGVQFSSEPQTSAPLIVDTSSDFLCRPLPVKDYGLIYACAQKNAGPAGVTVVIIRKDLLARSDSQLPGYLNFNSHVDAGSMFNTPPTFAIYLLDLVAQWLLNDVGGLATMHKQNVAKAQLLYDVIDHSDGFYSGHAQPQSRSIMNVTFKLPNDQAQANFVANAAKRGLCNLKGHRSVGGIRASIYNAMPVEGVEALRDFMQEFYNENKS